jgi:C1A family cysteine protease
MSETQEIKRGMGWRRDFPSLEDFTVEKNELHRRLIQQGEKETVKSMIKKLNVHEPAKVSFPGSVDLREWCSPIEDQETLGSCTANAAVGLIEYFEKRAFDKYVNASRLFLYKATRNLLQETGDTGASMRTTMGAMVLFGAPPEKYWPYNIANFDKEPPAFCYAFGQSFQSIQYYRLDDINTPASLLLKRIKLGLAAKLPSMFGFTVFPSYTQARKNGKIPFPCPGENYISGHAVVAVGYDDDLEITNTNCKLTTKGAIMIRNSWGVDWGEKGYGWLPYDYVLKGLAVDWWSLIKSEWVDTKRFGI